MREDLRERSNGGSKVWRAARGLTPLLLLAACASDGPKVASFGDGSARPANVQPEAVVSGNHFEGDYFEIVHDGRVYLVGSAASYAAQKVAPHLPYSHSRVGAGPAGETVIVELDPKDAAHQERLWDEYVRRHLFYEELQHEGRIYVVGSQKSLAALRETQHLAYTQTILGYGPQSATVIFEVDPKQEALQRRLRREFDRRHRYYAEEHREGRIYVIGDAALHGEFRSSGHLPYTASKIGKGPQGETLVFQVDTKDEGLLRRLEREFAARHASKQ